MTANNFCADFRTYIVDAHVVKRLNGMNRFQCGDIRAWLEGGSQDPPPADLLDHISGCDVCRGALLLAMSVETEEPPIIDCTACETLLPEFIDSHTYDHAIREHASNLAIILHLATCSECCAIYRATLALIAAERVGLLPPPPLQPAITQAVRFIHLLRIARSALQILLPAEPAIVTRGASERGSVIAEMDTGHGFALNVRVIPANEFEWALYVRLTPAQSGWLVVQLGDRQYRAPLFQDGTAHIPGIPAKLLNAPDGPPLELALEQAEW